LIPKWVRMNIVRRLQQLTENATVVIEAPLHDVVLYASTPTVIEGTEYDIPLIVHACVDVLRRTGKLMSYLMPLRIT
jgi:hypothetical protein